MVIGMYLPVVAQLHAQHGLITTGQLARAGLGPYEIDRLVSTGRLLRLRRGVYVDPDAWADLDPFRQQPRLRMRAASMSLTSTAYAFSHDSSAIVLDMGAPDPARPRWTASAFSTAHAPRSTWRASTAVPTDWRRRATPQCVTASPAGSSPTCSVG
jgi:hypothetical protein